MTDLLAELAGFPASVCAEAKRLSESVDFDPVDKPSPQSRSLEAYALVAERLVWLRRSTTMDETSRREVLRDLKSRLRTELRSLDVASAAAPRTAEPRATEPRAAEPRATEPRAAEPIATGPNATRTVDATRDATEHLQESPTPLSTAQRDESPRRRDVHSTPAPLPPLPPPQFAPTRSALLPLPQLRPIPAYSAHPAAGSKRSIEPPPAEADRRSSEPTVFAPRRRMTPLHPTMEMSSPPPASLRIHDTDAMSPVVSAASSRSAIAALASPSLVVGASPGGRPTHAQELTPMQEQPRAVVRPGIDIQGDDTSGAEGKEGEAAEALMAMLMA
jgi:hypothetical protein